ncbi:uncharacterized protein LOC131626114 [Vicia villosa]|uniref:uncharacterized protein LOC131626114 n=1 Tax=Vicia villosa TaxID=3911 RepID=UPI00273B3DEC|nr:uncharacterized protein LOC131626114 [Vicia villosa]
MNTHIKLLVWNCRGAASKAFYRYSKQYMDLYKHDLYVVIETRSDPSKLTKPMKRLGFDDCISMKNVGYSGGICVAWKADKMVVNLLHKETQFIHCRIKEHVVKEWLFTAIYASPNDSIRGILWDKICSLSKDMTEPWLLAGDFNDVASSLDKKGGAPVSHRKCKLFMDKINNCKLVHLETAGPKYTWRGSLLDPRRSVHLREARQNFE